MADLHHAGTPGRNTDIDAVGWVFLVVASFLIIVAALIAYEAHEVANAPVSQTVAR